MDDSALLARLQQLDTCVLSDALDAAGLEGAVHGLGPLTARRRIAGRVQTVRIGPAGDTSPGRHLATAAVEASREGDIIVIGSDGRTDAASWGGLLSAAAVSRGVSGVVVDGAVRDVDEARDLDLPVFALAAACRTARRRLQEVGWNEPVPVRGVTVHPGDYAVADSSGIVFLPADRAEELIARAEALAHRERSILEQIRVGVPVSEAMSAKYEAMLETTTQTGVSGG